MRVRLDIHCAAALSLTWSRRRLPSSLPLEQVDCGRPVGTRVGHVPAGHCGAAGSNRLHCEHVCQCRPASVLKNDDVSFINGTGFRVGVSRRRSLTNQKELLRDHWHSQFLFPISIVSLLVHWTRRSPGVRHVPNNHRSRFPRCFARVDDIRTSTACVTVEYSLPRRLSADRSVPEREKHEFEFRKDEAPAWLVVGRPPERRQMRAHRIPAPTRRRRTAPSRRRAPP